MLVTMLPIRPRPTGDDHVARLPDRLQFDEQLGDGGLPILRGELAAAPHSPLTLRLQVRNSAGIPIIEAQAVVSAGDRTVIFANLRPIGIDAYAHKPPAERVEIAARIWTRRAYGTLQLQR
jgi:hypothetical protein